MGNTSVTAGLVSVRLGWSRFSCAGKSLGPEASLSKLYWSEMEARLGELALDTLGARGELEANSVDGGPWFSEYLYARASMIYAGTSEIQKNILAQRVLGLPKE